MHFEAPEQEALRAEGLAVFADRLIVQARPPASPAQLAEVEAACAGPLPEALRALWGQAFGGRLDYDLELAFGDHVGAFSFTELFYPGSDHYRDLRGWIGAQREFEEESARQAGVPHDGRVRFLPIGGFEYLSRVFVQVAPGPGQGSVVVWKRGLPPAWRLRLHEDRQAPAAPDLRSFFRLLVLEDDPEAPTTEYPQGEEAFSAVAGLEQQGEVGVRAAHKLRGLLRGAVLRWEPALAEGGLASDARLRRLALHAVVRRDEVGLLEALAAQGCSLEEAFSGGGPLLDHALLRGAPRVARALLDRGVSVRTALVNAASQLDLELAKELLERGADVDAEAVLAARSEELALLLADQFQVRDVLGARRLVATALERAEGQERSAARIERGEMGSNRPPEHYRAIASRYRAVARRLQGG